MSASLFKKSTCKNKRILLLYTFHLANKLLNNFGPHFKNMIQTLNVATSSRVRNIMSHKIASHVSILRDIYEFSMKSK